MIATSMNADEKQEVTSARAGDESAFNELMAAHGREIRSYLYRMTACREDAEDLAQVVWVRVFRNLAKFEGRSSFRTWLFTIARSNAGRWRLKTMPARSPSPDWIPPRNSAASRACPRQRDTRFASTLTSASPAS